MAVYGKEVDFFSFFHSFFGSRVVTWWFLWVVVRENFFCFFPTHNRWKKIMDDEREELAEKEYS